MSGEEDQAKSGASPAPLVARIESWRDLGTSSRARACGERASRRSFSRPSSPA